MPVSAIDVAGYILQQSGEMTTMKLQKLVYYCQAWSLVWDEAPLFSEPIEAWANGPVVKALFDCHCDRFTITCSCLRANPEKLSDLQKETIASVLEFYGDKNSQWLTDLTHMEEPWKQARVGLEPGERGEREITPASMANYYSSL